MADWFDENAPKSEPDWFSQNAPAQTAVAEPPAPAAPAARQPSNPAAYMEDKIMTGLGVGPRVREIVANAEEALGNVGKGFIPQSPGDVAKLLTPIASLPEEGAKTYHALSDVLFGGKGIEETQRKYFPEAYQIADAEKTAPFSKERFGAGFGLVAQLGMAAGIVHGMEVKPPLLTDALFKKPEEAVPLTETPVIEIPAPEPIKTVESAPVNEPAQVPSVVAEGARVEPAPPEVPPTVEPPAVAEPIIPEPPPPVEAIPEAPQSPTGVRNAIVDEQRKARGLPERMAPLRKSNPEAWDEAMTKIDQNQNAGRELVNDVKDNPRALKPEETALLTHETVTRENAFDNAVDEVNNAKDPSALAEAKQRLASARDDVQELYDVGQKAGTESGQSLQARKILANQDYSLARMEAVKRAVANEGKPLSESQAAEVKAAHEKIAELQKKLDEHEARQSTEKQAEIYRQIVKESLTSAKEGAKTGKSLQSVLDEAAAKARARIVERRGRLQVTVDPLNVAGLVDEAIIGASHLARGLTKFGDWSAQMVKDFGERINPYLKDLWDRAKQYHDAHAKLFEKSGPKEPATPEETLAKIQENAAAGKDLSQKQVFDLARAHVNAGVEGLDNVMAKVTEDLQGAHPGITEREVRDTFTGYGETKIPSKAADLAALRDYRRQGQLVSALEDAMRSEAPKKSGMQRDKPSQRVRELQKQLQAVMKEHGIETTSPEQQLSSTNQARATALRNQIEDLEKRLRTGEKPTKGKPVPETKEVSDLKVRRDALKEELRKVEGDPPRTPMTNEQKLARLKTVLKNKTEAIQKKIATNDYTKPTRRQTELDAEALSLKKDYQKERSTWEQRLMEDERAKRGWFEKTTSFIKSLTRASILSHVSVLEHLGGAAIENVVTRPITSVAAQLMRINRTANAIRTKAVYEGGWGGEMKGAKGLLTSLRATGQKLFHGKSDLDWLHGAKHYPKEFGEIVGNVHGAIKEPVRQGIYARAMELGVKAAEEKGLNPATDPVLRDAISKDAYDMANMDIFMGDNFLTKAMHNNAVSYLRGEKGNPGLAKFTADVLDTLFPVVNVPVNIAIRKFRLLTGLPEAAVRVASAAKEGKLSNLAEKLSKQEAEQITRAFKYGLVGAALTVYAWNNPEQFGGIRVAGQNAPRDKSNKLSPGEIALPGDLHISHHVAHGPFGGHLNMVADARRLYDKQVKSNPNSQWSNMGEAGFFMLFSAAKDLPMMSTVGRLTSPFYSAGQKAGELMKNMFVPGIVQDYAQYRDPKQREAKTFTQQIQSAVPGLREQLKKKD